MREAAALPLAVITAWEGLVDRARVEAGQTGAGPRRRRRCRARRHPDRPGPRRRGLRHRLAPEPRDHRATSERPRSTTPPPRSRTTSPSTPAARASTSSSTPSAGPPLDASFTAVRTYTGHVVSALGWGTHSLAPLSFRGAELLRRLHAAADADRPRPRAPRRDPARGRRPGRRGGAASQLSTPAASPWPPSTDAHEAVETGTAAGKVVIDVA